MSHQIEGVVTSVSGSGDLITDIAVASVESAPADDSVKVTIGPHETAGIFDLDHGEPDATMIAVRGTSGHLEIGIVGMNMSEMLGIKVGEKVSVRW